MEEDNTGSHIRRSTRQQLKQQQRQQLELQQQQLAEEEEEEEEEQQIQLQQQKQKQLDQNQRTTKNQETPEYHDLKEEDFERLMEEMQIDKNDDGDDGSSDEYIFSDESDDYDDYDNINNNNNTTNINNPTPPTRFHSKTPPAISIFSYINRLTKFNNLKSSGLITMIYYIDILSYMYPHFQLNSWTIHRFLLVATMISQKAMEDYFYTNDHYAKVGGVSLEELNCLELDFLKRIDWRTIPINNPNVQQLYYNKLVEMTGKISNMVDNNNSSDSDNTDTRYKHTKFIMENEDPTDDEEEEEGDLEDLEEDLEDDDDEDDDDEDDEFYDSDEDINSEDNGDIEIDDYEMEEENNSNVPDLPNIPMYKYDNNGFSMDGSSSPHLKRRYSKD